MEPTPHGSLVELARLFLRLGIISFGGPAAHIALMRAEFVRQRAWLTDQHFLDLLGATNLIPGPNSTEMAIHIGYLRAGWRGLIVAGVCFILPAMLIVLALAAAYVAYGTTPAVGWLLYGVKPVVLAVVAQALWGLAKTAVKGWATALVGAAVLALACAGVNEIALLALGGLALLLAAGARRRAAGAAGALALPGAFGAALASASAPAAFSLLTLFLTFLKIGAVLYGSGYVLLAFLRADLVVRLGWLTDQQLLDAVAIGQVTPGPVFTTATFIGYILGGVAGALLATLGIFAPAFIFVALSNPLIPRIRSAPAAAVLLDGVNVASLALMAAVTAQLGQAAVVDALTAALALLALLALVRFKVNSVWLVGVGGAVGVAYRLLAG